MYYFDLDIYFYIINMSQYTNLSAENNPELPTAKMSSFVKAVLSSQNPEQGVNRTFGENGAVELTLKGMGDNLLGLFEKSVRGLEDSQIRFFIEEIIREENVESLANLFVLLFQTRSCRVGGGKGERLITYKMIKILYEYYPLTIISLLEVLPAYGYWQDLNSLLIEIHQNPVESINYKPLRETVWYLWAKQLDIDRKTLEKGGTNLTFAGKWAPRSKSKPDRILNATSEIIKHLELTKNLVLNDEISHDKELARKAWDTARKIYRTKYCSPLNKALEVPEVNMCAQKWAEIEISKIPSLCMNRRMKALLNEMKDVIPSCDEDETGNRFPDNEDRVNCRQNVLDCLTKKGLSGKQLYPHEIYQKSRINLSSGVRAILNAQWNTMKQGIVDVIKNNTEPGIDLSKAIPICDVSGSMSGVPMDVSVALGVLVSEITHPAFRNLVMTFSEKPSWHSLEYYSNVVDKFKSLSKAAWGMSTNFYKSMELISQIAIEQNLKEEDIPSLIVFSDMQFNVAACKPNYDYSTGEYRNTSWDTTYEKIVKLWETTGNKISGSPYNCPQIIFWNLRSDTTGYPVDSNQKNVSMLSGYSPSLMKFVLSGQLVEEVEEIDNSTGQVKKVKKQLTPSETLAKVLSDSHFDSVRTILSTSDENMLSSYSFNV